MELPLPSLCSKMMPRLAQGTMARWCMNQGVLPAHGKVFPRKHWHTGNHGCQEGLEQKEPRNGTTKSC